jgi:hypothetical protein
MARHRRRWPRQATRVLATAIALCATTACSLVLGIRETTVGETRDGEGPNDANGPNGDAGGDAFTQAQPPCPSASDDTTIVVDAEHGDDAVAASSDAPYRSITKALAFVNASAGTARTVCVRAGIYSETTTNEVFPLKLGVSGMTLRGEGQDKVTITLSSANEAGPEGRPLGIDAPMLDTTVRGVTLTTTKGIGVLSKAAGLQVLDATFDSAGGGGFDTFLRSEGTASIERTRFVVLPGNQPFSCVEGVRGARITITDAVLDGCYSDVLLQEKSVATLVRATCRNGTWAGVWANGGSSLTTKDCIFESNGHGVLIDGLADLGSTTFVATSTGDTFKANRRGLVVDSASASTSSSIAVTSARFRAHSEPALALLCPIRFTMRASSFEEGQGSAVVISNPSVAQLIDLGDADGGGNAIQSVSHPNRNGICLQTSGTLLARGNGFAACPPQTSADCNGGDVSTMNGGMVDTNPCFVAP